MPVWRGVLFSEKRTDSPEEAIVPGAESRATRTIWTPWDERQTASALMCGYSEVLTDATTSKKYISRHTPWPHPDWPGFLYATDFGKISGYQPDSIGIGDVGTFEEAACTVNFKSPANGLQHLEDAQVVDNQPDHEIQRPLRFVPAEYFLLRQCEITESFKAKYQTIPAGAGLYWGTPAGPKAHIHQHVLLFSVSLTIVLRQWPQDAFNYTAMMALVGKTNAEKFPAPAVEAGDGTIPGLLEPRGFETLVWGVPTVKRVWQGDRTYALDITLNLEFFPAGANKFFWWQKPGGPGYETLVRPDGSVIYPAGDYFSAFVPP
jgi:hypothetical protein